MAGITREELLILIEAIVRERPHAFRVDANFLSKDHSEFCRIVGGRLTEALAGGGYAWARIPTHGDHLYKLIVAATDNVGYVHRVGLSSTDQEVALFARHSIANKILEHLSATKTTVVRRKMD